jgi:hypothetical protein
LLLPRATSSVGDEDVELRAALANHDPSGLDVAAVNDVVAGLPECVRTSDAHSLA